MEITKDLNEAQVQAVVYNDGPQLVIAGAGSGKTRVLTCKIAYLLQMGVPASRILALTFTNKAAREMNQRISSLLGGESTRYLWSGTFHSIFARILRRESAHIGFTSDFTIYDTSDSRSLLKSIVKEMGLDEKMYKPQLVASKISMAKNRLVLPAGYAADASFRMRDERDGLREMPRIYEAYFHRCRQSNAMDFDDLLLYTFILFRDKEVVRNAYRERFVHILVDEYQDTNYAQYMIIAQLTTPESKICVVGDDAQSIYGFRGASIDNILNFQSHFPTTVVTKLECNYRSTECIVEAANSIIKNNRRQIPKNVYSHRGGGAPITLYSTYSDKDESLKVAAEISRLVRREGVGYNDIGLLYRTNAQSRSFEEAFRQSNIPYRIYGGLSFFQRKEVKDVIAYFRLMTNPHDEEAFKRVVNYPARGIGQTTLAKVQAAAHQNDVSMWEIAKNATLYDTGISGATQKKLLTFVMFVEGFSGRMAETSAYSIAKDLISESGIIRELQMDPDVEAQSKLENVQELLNAIQEYELEAKEERGVTHVSIVEYLNQVALLTDADVDDEDQMKVTLMTVHAAKGLEFDTVFITGMEDGLFPSENAQYSEREIEEERRLFYVAVTRAKRLCYLTYAKSRYRWGKTEYCSISPFVEEIDSRYIQTEHGGQVGNTPKPFLNKPAKAEPVRKTFGGMMNSSSGRTTPMPSRASNLQRVSSLNTSPATAHAQNTSGLKVGAIVEHDRFGVGTVISLDGTGDNAKAVVDFTNAGLKTLLLRFAKITIVS